MTDPGKDELEHLADDIGVRPEDLAAQTDLEPEGDEGGDALGDQAHLRPPS